MRKHDMRHDRIRVKIKDVDLSVPAFPLAIGNAPQGGPCHIDLSYGVAGMFIIPAVGETWWIERRKGTIWALAHKESNRREVRELSPGDIKVSAKNDLKLQSDDDMDLKVGGNLTINGRIGFTGGVQVTSGNTTITLNFEDGVFINVS